MQYPSENEYSKFLSQHAGSSNAYTSDTCTTYFFDVAPDSLEPALDRFAQFFIDPLMLADSVTREMEAVNSEYQKNKENDGWRECQIQRLLGDQTHDFSKFNIGNLETLRDVPNSKKLDIRQELFKFHEKWYSANNMHLCVLGKEPLDDLEKIVVPMFTPIVNRNVKCQTWDHPYKAEHLMKEVRIVPIKDKRCMSISFVYPDETKHYKSAPGHYLSHLIGHEGHGSLLSELKELGLVSGLASWTDSNDGFGSFNVSVELTEEGLKRTSEVATHFFQYINLLKEKGPQEYIHKELKELAFIKFNFMEKQNPIDAVEKYAAKMFYYPIEEIISANIVLEEFRPDLINEMLAYLKVENCQISLVSKNFQGQTDKVEHFFGINYKVEPLSDDLVKSIKNAGLNPKYSLPPPNELIPTDFKIVSEKKDDTISKIPARIFKDDILSVWYLQDHVFLKPKVFHGFRLANPINLQSPHTSNCHNLFSMLFTDALTEYLYDAKLAGLVFDILQNEVGYTLQFFGYNHKMGCFIKRVLERLASYKIDPHRFAIQKERFERWLKSYKTQPLYKLVNYYNGLMIYEDTFTYEERIAVLDKLTLESVQTFWTDFMKTMSVDALMYGNLSKASADETVKIFRDNFLVKTTPLASDLPKTLREVQLPTNSSHLLEAVNEVQTMKAILTYYQVSNDYGDRCALYIIDQILSEPFFDYLRTKEQLGYIVFSKYHQNFGVSGMQFIIQSQFGAKYLEKRIEAFVAWAEKYIQDMSDQEFEKEKSSLITKLMKKKKRLYHFATQLHYEIERQEFDFERKEKLIAGIKAVNKKDVVNIFTRAFNRNGEGRQKVTIRINRDKPEENILEPSDEAKKDIIPAVEFKVSLEICFLKIDMIDFLI